MNQSQNQNSTINSNSPTQEPSKSPPKWRYVAYGAVGAIGVLVVGAMATVSVVRAQWGGGGWRHHGGGYGYHHDGMRMGGRGDMGGPARFARFCNNDTERYVPVVRLLAKTDLRLDDAQSKAFDNLADKVFPALTDLKREACNNFAAQAGASPERIAQLATVLRKAADAAEGAVAPARTFYDGLNNDQKARVDALANRRRGQ